MKITTFHLGKCVWKCRPQNVVLVQPNYAKLAKKCCPEMLPFVSLRWRHNDHAVVSNHQPHGCLLNRLFRRKSKKTSKLRVTGFCVGNSPGTGEFPAQMASYAENVSIWWRHHVFILILACVIHPEPGSLSNHTVVIFLLDNSLLTTPCQGNAFRIAGL